MKPLTYFCDTPQIQRLISKFGDRLQHLDRSSLFQLISTITLTCNESELQYQESDYTIQQFTQDMDLILSVEMETVIEILEGLDCRNYSSLLLGLASINHDRSSL